jgi:hypothetical protein
MSSIRKTKGNLNNDDLSKAKDTIKQLKVSNEEKEILIRI